MNWLHDISYLFGGIFLANAVPHFVSGTMGQAFQSPFAKPRDRGFPPPPLMSFGDLRTLSWPICCLFASAISICMPPIRSSPPARACC